MVKAQSDSILFTSLVISADPADHGHRFLVVVQDLKHPDAYRILIFVRDDMIITYLIVSDAFIGDDIREFDQEQLNARPLPIAKIFPEQLVFRNPISQI